MLTEVSKADPIQRQREAAEAAIRGLKRRELYLYTDGSAEEGVKNGGGGIAVYNEGGNKIHGWLCPARRQCSSYSAELAVMKSSSTAGCYNGQLSPCCRPRRKRCRRWSWSPEERAMGPAWAR